MNATAPVVDAPRTTGDPSFGGLVQIGETLVAAVKRLEAGPDYGRIIASENGQRLLEAINAQVRDARNGKGRAPAKKLTPEEAPAQAAAEAAAEVAEAIDVLAVASIAMIPIASIDIGTNVRVNVAELDELTASIQEHGVLQPIKVRPAGDRFTIVWGQRRFLASRQAGLTAIPAIVDVGIKTTSVLAIEQLVENLHRADLPPLDRARAMRAVVDAGMSQVDLARELGIATSTISNDLGLLESPASIQKAVETGELTPSHAKALKGLAPKTQQELAKDSIAGGWSAHRLEDEVQRRKQQAERQAEQERQSAEATKKNIADLEASITELAAKKKPGLDTEIVVFDDYYNRDDGQKKQLAAALTRAGFTKVRIQSGRDEAEARPKGCTCTSWRATLKSSYSYGAGGYTTRLQATPACVVPKHRQDKATADRKAEADKYALQGKVQAHVKATASAWVVPEARAIAVDRILAEAILWGAIGYNLPEWAVARGGSRQKPWATLHALTDEELAAELWKMVAGDFRDKAGYHVDWTSLAGELGLEGDEQATAS